MVVSLTLGSSTALQIARPSRSLLLIWLLTSFIFAACFAEIEDRESNRSEPALDFLIAVFTRCYELTHEQSPAPAQSSLTRASSKSAGNGSSDNGKSTAQLRECKSLTNSAEVETAATQPLDEFDALRSAVSSSSATATATSTAMETSDSTGAGDFHWLFVARRVGFSARNV